MVDGGMSPKAAFFSEVSQIKNNSSNFKGSNQSERKSVKNFNVDYDGSDQESLSKQERNMKVYGGPYSRDNYQRYLQMKAYLEKNGSPHTLAAS